MQKARSSLTSGERTRRRVLVRVGLGAEDCFSSMSDDLNASTLPIDRDDLSI
jgi:hypothetical protein